MKVAGIISEYNPFHNGHLYHIEQTRKCSATHIVCAMSGNFVQRGDCACAEKHIRAKAAVLSGADLVVEIPTPWACSGAESFARGGVGILTALGMDVLSFGCETDDLSLLTRAAVSVDSPAIAPSVRTFLSAGNTYPAALQKSVDLAFGSDIAEILSSPNNTLAVEYIRQKLKLCVEFELLPIKRKNAKHNDSTLKNGNISSASALRRICNPDEIKHYIPDAMYNELSKAKKDGLYPCSLDYADRVIIAILRRTPLEEMKGYILDENGLAQRLHSATQTAQSIDELVCKVKVKSITEAAIRRAVLSCYLKISKEICKGVPPYIRILAANRKGFEILKNRKPSIPVVTNKSDIDKLTGFGKMVFDLECDCTDSFSLFSKKISDCSRELTSPVFIL